MEIPSSHAGVIKELKIKLGDKVSKGTPVATLTAAVAAQKPAQVAATAQASTTAPAPAPEQKADVETPTRSHAFATEMGARPEPLDLGPRTGREAARIAFGTQVRTRAWAWIWRPCEAAVPRDALPKTMCARTLRV